ncbi:DDE-type integrase/transposase/recombinase [Streptomyces sp. ISL-86]|uniref:DDE-type integrase/transposase/recombinase n=1 Tax=Streptomyces sp. ISL-86 TaxID=2819187 RepID=UPI001BE6AF98|nr:DDE-type integrase/transposase/recombinase [Streptomyces sp. ISL-86]MBT2458636.1 DDE-type integrase/transposase/recombinase [Streptomyces sp. ISL-86]
MSAWTTTLRPGLPLAFDGEQFTVAEIEGRRVLLQQLGALGEPRWRQVDTAVLLSHPTTRILVDAPEPETAVATVLGALSGDEDDALTVRYRHVQEVLTGYRLGCVELALEGEPRPQYAPGVPVMRRYAAKAAELGVGESTIRRWVVLAEAGPAGLLKERRTRDVLDRADPRWVDAARDAVARRVKASRPVRDLLLLEIEERLGEVHGRNSVPSPARTTAYAILRELDRGTNAFTGSTKGKRSIANRPQGTYGRLRATRPGEYIVLDTNRLDVFAMEPVTCRWVQCELTVAMDLYSRCITGLRLTPVSTKSVDVAGVLFETVRTQSPAAAGEVEPLPYCGIPATVVLDAEKLVDAADDGQPLLPSVAAEAIVFDHGKVYLSNHIRSVCAKFGISLQPARPYTPTDKPIERWFRTLGEGLLAALPGYKGPDVHSRGEKVEEEAFFFIDELEAIIREWIVLVYHRRHHRGLAVPEFPKLKLSPLEMLDHGINRAGPLTIPARADMVFDFLEEAHVTIQHYGVDYDTLRYNGDALNSYRNTPSSLRGPDAGKWPIAVDTADVTRVYFQHPREKTWHALPWEHAPAMNGPVSREAVGYARRLAAKTHRFPDTRRALVELLERWGAGLTADRVERRMAVRLSQQRLRLLGEDETVNDVAGLPTARRITALHTDTEPSAEPDAGAATPDLHLVDTDLGGDDDEDEECAAAFPGEENNLAIDEDDFYADAWESR